MSYTSASTVAGYCKNLLGPDRIFSESSCPRLDEVNHWLSTGCGVLETVLSNQGYNTPVSAGVPAYDWLNELNALWGAAFSEMSRTNMVLEPGARTRGQVFYEMFWEQLDRLVKLDLTRMGVGRNAAGAMYVSGVKRARIDSVQTNTTYVRSRFERNMFKFPGTIDPVGQGGSAVVT